MSLKFCKKNLWWVLVESVVSVLPVSLCSHSEQALSLQSKCIKGSYCKAMRSWVSQPKFRKPTLTNFIRIFQVFLHQDLSRLKWSSLLGIWFLRNSIPARQTKIFWQCEKSETLPLRPVTFLEDSMKSTQRYLGYLTTLLEKRESVYSDSTSSSIRLYIANSHILSFIWIAPSSTDSARCLVQINHRLTNCEIDQLANLGLWEKGEMIIPSIPNAVSA